MGNKWYNIKASSKSLDINIHGVIGWEVNSVDILNSIIFVNEFGNIVDKY